MEFTSEFRVSDQEAEVVCRDVVLVIDVSVAHAEGELHVKVLAHWHCIAVGESCAPEVELLTDLSAKLEVTVSAPSVCSDEMAYEGITLLEVWFRSSCTREEPPSCFSTEAEELEAEVVFLVVPPWSCLEVLEREVLVYRYFDE